jgi:hypothetical protein
MNWTNCIAISGNYMLRRPKHSKNEVVAPEEEEEEEKEEGGRGEEEEDYKSKHVATFIIDNKLVVF